MEVNGVLRRFCEKCQKSRPGKDNGARKRWNAQGIGTESPESPVLSPAKAGERMT